MKGKPIIATIVAIILIAGLITTIIIINNPDKEKVKDSGNPANTVKVDESERVKIYFNTDGGSSVETMTLKKGESITLPTSTKKGYVFLGWYLDGKKVEDGAIFENNTTLVAKWEKTKEDPKTFTVTFDSKGGSSISKVQLECGKELSLPKNPTKSGYVFVRWEDKNGKAINNKVLFSCEDVTLYAVWEKEKSYICPSEYKLEGTKCVIEATPKEKCGERGYEYEGKCVTIAYNVRQDTKNTCGKTTVHTGGGHTEEVQGELFKMGTNYCFFKQVTDSYENNQSNCTSRGHYWNSENKTCYYYRGSANQFVTSTCDHLTNYAYITNPNNYEGVNGLNGGCFPLSDKVKYCDNDYTLTNGKCVKSVDAILE